MFVGQVDRVDPFRRDDADGVGVVAETHLRSGNVVGNDDVEVLAGQLSAGVFNEVRRLGRETHEDLPRSFCGTEAGKDVGRWLEHDRRRTVLFLPLALRNGNRSEVGDRGGHDDDIGTGSCRINRSLHLGRSLDRDLGETRRSFTHKGNRCDERDLCAASCGLGCDRMPLLATGTVRNHTHGVDRLAGTTRSHDDMTTGERRVNRQKQPTNCRKDRLGRCEATLAHITSGQTSVFGVDDVHAA